MEDGARRLLTVDHVNLMIPAEDLAHCEVGLAILPISASALLVVPALLSSFSALLVGISALLIGLVQIVVDVGNPLGLTHQRLEGHLLEILIFQQDLFNFKR